MRKRRCVSFSFGAPPTKNPANLKRKERTKRKKNEKKDIQNGENTTVSEVYGVRCTVSEVSEVSEVSKVSGFSGRHGEEEPIRTPRRDLDKLYIIIVTHSSQEDPIGRHVGTSISTCPGVVGMCANPYPFRCMRPSESRFHT